MLRINRKVNEYIEIGNRDLITVTVVQICGDSVRLQIDAPPETEFAMPREFEPDTQPTGDAEHFVREGLAALDNLAESPCPGLSGLAAHRALARDKFRKALAILTAGKPPVVHSGK